MVALQLENQRCEFPPEEVDRITGQAATDSHNAFQLQREHEGGPPSVKGVLTYILFELIRSYLYQSPAKRTHEII